jgi:Ran GTPase-activating protein (RanGAP) involved in mRNA processing and transport
MDASIIKAGEIIKKCQKAKTQKPVVDLSVPMMDKSFVLEDGLHWLNATVNGSLDGIKTSGLTISNRTVTDEDIASIGRYLNVSPSMYEISLRNCLKPCDSLRIPLEMGYFRNISHLNISDNALFEKTCRPVGLMFATSLKNLEVQNCSLGDDGLKHLAVDLSNMAHLRQLNIANNRITASGLLSLTKAMGGNKAMTGLRIHKNYFGRDGSVILASWLESLILLEVLNVSECGIGDKGSPIIASSLVSRSLKKLSMRKNELSPRGSRDFFRNFQRPPYLEHLDFSENKIFATSDRRSLSVAEDLSPTAQEEPFLDFLLQPRAMNHLSLWNTYLGQKRIFMSLNSYTCFEEMTYLCLQENNISDDFARDVCECIKLSNCIYIQHFNLRQNHIGNNGAKCIAEMLGAQKYLKDILLDRNEIGDEGANQIASASMFLPSFQFLDLSCNNISRGRIMRIVWELEARVKTEQESSYPGIKLGEGGIIQKQSSYEENNFKINREMDKFLVTT